MKKTPPLTRNILENMSEGVLAIDPQGRITIFNPAAGRILGIKDRSLVGRNFAQALLDTEGNDSFSQALLDAVYDKQVGHTRVVELSRDPDSIHLRVTTSYLRRGEEDNEKSPGIVAVFSDISDRIQREKELQTACQDLERSNTHLDGALARIRTMRRFALVFALLLVAGGLFFWSRAFITIDAPPAQSDQGRINSQQKSLVVQPAPLSTELYLAGTLSPLEIVNVVSPVSGKVKEVFFHYGGDVEKGQPLLEMDLSAIRVNLREARSAYIKARQQLNRLQNWENDPEVNRARRRLNKSSTALAHQERTLAETRRLFDQGIISKSEYTSAEQRLFSMRIDHQSLEEELAATIRRGKGENLDIVQLAADSAGERYRELERQLENAVVKAPVSGVIIRLPENAQDKAIRRGSTLEQGQLILTIGNREGLSVQTRIDEVDLPRLKTGQAVVITGDGFSGTRLAGRITAIDSQATVRAGIPTFDVTVSITDLPPEARNRVRLGMSARLAVVTLSKPEAILLPLAAVMSSPEGAFVLRRKKDGSGVERVLVSTGTTTPDAVEIVAGLQPGDEVIYE
jgi:HlyD family secretion protein